MEMKKANRTLAALKEERYVSWEELWGLMQDAWDDFLEEDAGMVHREINADAQEKLLVLLYRMLGQFEKIPSGNSPLQKRVQKKAEQCEGDVNRMQNLLDNPKIKSLEQSKQELRRRLEEVGGELAQVQCLEKTAEVLKETAAVCSDTDRLYDVSGVVKTAAENMLRQTARREGRAQLEQAVKEVELRMEETKAAKEKLDEKLEEMRQAYGVCLRG